jgi:LuxR family maltose regulon positive regulatory protein
MNKPDRLIRTKLRRPFIRPKLVPRPRLQEQIAHGLRGPLTLITAPAGFGKTTLVASCITTCGMTVAWLSLDRDDNQAGHFLNYLVAALQEADLTIGSEAAQLLAASRQAPPEAVLTSLINDLDVTTREIVLVLDDYQFISSQTVHEQVAFLLEHCPKTFHLMIATRSDPPLPLSRLRVRGQTVELRAADLRFTEPEAVLFLNDVMGLRLDARSVAALEERTEGWIAGLQMASLALQARLSMRNHEDVSEFIEGFSGTNRYILDYLLEEVLASQPPEIQRFLLHTSILERLTAPLCDAVLANDEGFRSQSASILEYLKSEPLPGAPG